MSRNTSIGLWLVLLATCAPGCASLHSSNDLPLEPTSPASSMMIRDPLVPSNSRDWHPPLAVLPVAEFDGDRVTVKNVRNFRYLSENDYVSQYNDRSYDLAQLRTVDFVFVPFNESNLLAHTFLSFGFADGEYLAVSVEVRLEKNETYSPMYGALRQYEIMYVVADEQDVIPLRTEIRDVDVYIFRTNASPQQTRKLFDHVFARVNKLAASPEFYDTFANNCTTNIVNHVNTLRPGRIPYDYRVLLPGYTAQLAYDLGLLETTTTFEKTKERSRVTEEVGRYLNHPKFSRKIREKTRR